MPVCEACAYDYLDGMDAILKVYMYALMGPKLEKNGIEISCARLTQLTIGSLEW